MKKKQKQVSALHAEWTVNGSLESVFDSVLSAIKQCGDVILYQNDSTILVKSGKALLSRLYSPWILKYFPITYKLTLNATDLNVTLVQLTSTHIKSPITIEGSLIQQEGIFSGETDIKIIIRFRFQDLLIRLGAPPFFTFERLILDRQYFDSPK